VATRRTRPLTAEDAAPADRALDVFEPPGGDGDLVIAHDAHIVDPEGEQARLQQLSEGIQRLRVGGGTLRLGERTLMVIGGVLAPVGLLVIVLGWVGAANTGYVFEQVPYLISGGLLGISLVFLGAFFYFAHWMTELVKEHRAQSTAIIDALSRLQAEVVRQAGDDRYASASPSPNGSSDAAARGPATAEARDLVATPTGTMVHRPECVVVAGKSGLRRVAAAEGLAACKLCDPYGAG
jgi:hypothetical protein